jgi:hypothetical protein
MFLHADFVPQSQMFLRRWFKPKTHAEWFYHAPLTKPTVSNKQEHEIIKTLDEPLRDLFMFLSINGFKTLPSCSGHFLTKNDQRKKYNLFTNDLSTIKTKGLVVKDVENDKVYRYVNPNYLSPWNLFNEFSEQMENHAPIGYIGIIQPPNNIDMVDGPINIHTDRKYFDIPVTHITVNNQKESDIKPNWSKVLEIAKSVLDF